MSSCAGEIGPSVTSGRDNCVVRSESVNGAVSNAHCDATSALSLFVHYQIENEIFNEKVAIVAQRSAEQCMQHSVSCSVSCASCSVGLKLAFSQIPVLRYRTSSFVLRTLAGKYFRSRFWKKAIRRILVPVRLPEPPLSSYEWHLSRLASQNLLLYRKNAISSHLQSDFPKLR
jgi:hypothetical protein